VTSSPFSTNMGDILDPDFTQVAFGDDSKHNWHATPVLDPGFSHYHFGPFPEIEAPLLQGKRDDLWATSCFR
jgi:hypothetical protein